MRKVIVLLMFAALPAVACGRHKTAGPAPPTTQTISPAAAKPSPDGTDAMTQTVDVDDSRSESDGMASAATPKTAKTKPATKAPAKKKAKK